MKRSYWKVQAVLLIVASGDRSCSRSSRPRRLRRSIGTKPYLDASAVIRVLRVEASDPVGITGDYG